MYQDYVTTKDEAICHLFFHCCFKDGNFSPDEIDTVSSKFVELQMHRDLNIKEELSHYRSCKNEIADETDYLRYLLKMINPVQNFALYSYCCELCLSDKLLTADEESLLNEIARLTEIDNSERIIITKLLTQRKAVELEKLF